MELVLQLTLTSWGILIVMMTLLWLVHIRISNAAVVDVGWGAGFVLLAVVYGALGDGLLERRLLMAGMVVLWGIRLSVHLLVDRVVGSGSEDGRYTELRRKWNSHLHLKFFLFFQFQAFLIVILSLPFLFMALNTSEPLTWIEWAGFAIWTIGIAGESAADTQLRRFKKNEENRGKVCETGLWNYSRHPNYFFEWVVWIGYCVAALPSPYGWTSVNSALIMAFLLTRVTGIPPAEEQALRTKGDAYRRYQRTTSAFFPWVKRSDA